MHLSKIAEGIESEQLESIVGDAFESALLGILTRAGITQEAYTTYQATEAEQDYVLSTLCLLVATIYTHTAKMAPPELRHNVGALFIETVRNYEAELQKEGAFNLKGPQESTTAGIQLF